MRKRDEEKMDGENALKKLNSVWKCTQAKRTV